ncbi:MAG: hypothetical protein AB1749_17405 [Pseudomonadota bacterium]
MKISTILASATLIAGLTIAALPASADIVDRRQHNQDHRIDQGVRSGTLTSEEAARLRREQDEIADLERRFERDGKLSYWEKQRLAELQSKASRHIYNQKHDGDVSRRIWYKPWSWQKPWGWGRPWGWNKWSDNRHDHDEPSYRRWW